MLQWDLAWLAGCVSLGIGQSLEETKVLSSICNSYVIIDCHELFSLAALVACLSYDTADPSSPVFIRVNSAA